MTWLAEQKARPPRIEWMLQIQQKPKGAWSDHTGGLHDREEADALLSVHRAAYPQCRYRLVRMTTTYTIESGRPQ